MKTLEINGYFTIVENEILDFLPLIGLTKRELEFMIVLIRLTNGFKKGEDRIPLSQFYNMTRIEKGNGSKTLTKLLKKKLVYKNGSSIGINKDFSQWEGVVKLTTYKGLSIWQRKVVNSYNKKVVNLDPSKETSKETIKRKVLSKPKGEKKEREVPEGLKELLKDIGNFPGLKK